jgi:hypothetical protein
VIRDPRSAIRDPRSALANVLGKEIAARSA